MSWWVGGDLDLFADGAYTLYYAHQGLVFAKELLASQNWRIAFRSQRDDSRGRIKQGRLMRGIPRARGFRAR